jgi:hypothetical protein
MHQLFHSTQTWTFTGRPESNIYMNIQLLLSLTRSRSFQVPAITAQIKLQIELQHFVLELRNEQILSRWLAQHRDLAHMT